MKNDCRTTVGLPASLFANQRRFGVEAQSGLSLRTSVNKTDQGALSRQIRREGLIRRILVPTDFSAPSATAVTKAVSLAQQCKASVTLLYVMDLNLHTPPTGPANAEELQQRLCQEGREKLDAMVLGLRNQGVELRTLISEGKPSEQICEAARQCDLIVVGQARPKLFWRWFSRRTVEAVLERAPCPVLVVRRVDQPEQGED